MMTEARLMKDTTDMIGKKRQRESGKRPVLCHCPKCGADHRIRMRWIGRGRPRKYCALCRSSLKSVSGNAYLLDLHLH